MKRIDYEEKSARGISSRGMMALLVLTMTAIVGCTPQNPDESTPTTGKLLVYADELYAPLVVTLADSFMLKHPNSKIEVRALPARMAVQHLFDADVNDTSAGHTMITTAVVIGRRFLSDEAAAAKKGNLETKEYVLAYDGFGVVVPNGSPLKAGTLERLRSALNAPHPTMSMIDSTAGDEPVRFIRTDQNSSAYPFVQSKLVTDSAAAIPARYFSSGDSLLAAVVAGEGIGLVGWYTAHRDSARLRTMKLGFTDSTGRAHQPVPVHPTSLVMGLYPLKQPLVGYTFAANHSLAFGFLAWLATAQDAQYYMANQGLQPEHVKIRVVLPEEE